MGATATRPRTRSVELAPITRDDLTDVGAFLHSHLNPRLGAAAWTSSIVQTWWVDDVPNAGFLLRAEGRVVGVQLAFYSRRTIDGRTEDFCNLGAWCVLEEHRAHGLRLLRAVLAQPGYTFTDLSPSGNVVALNERLGFERLDTSSVLLTNLPFGHARGCRVLSDPETVGDLLRGPELRIFHDHMRASAALHLVLRDHDHHCYVVVRRDRRKQMPVFASVLHASDPAVLRRHLGTLGNHLLVHHGIPFTLVEVRKLGGRRPAFTVPVAGRTKMFRSATVPAERIDDLYSELALVAW